MAGEGAVVAAAAGDGADRRMVHRVGRPRRRAGVAVAALHRAARNVRRRHERLRTRCSFAGVGTVVAGAARRAANRRVVHCIGREACSRIGVAIATLKRSGRNMRRRGQASCGGAVVAARTVGVGRRMGKRGTSPSRGAGVTGRALSCGGDVTRSLALRT